MRLVTFSIDDLKSKARVLQEILEREHVRNIRDLEKIMDCSFIINRASKEQVTIEKRPSNSGTWAYSVSYNEEGLGIPINIFINPILEYIQVVVKGKFRLRGYSEFATDSRGNIAQAKLITSSVMADVRTELTNLANYK